MTRDDSAVYLAVDLGAESGRVVAGSLEGGAIRLAEVHRFPNGPTKTTAPEGELHWDFEGLWKHILDGLAAAAKQYGERVASIGVDTWGVDYGLVDAQGKLLAQPYHYRDSRTEGMQVAAFKRVARREIYDVTGIQFMDLNTIYQLLAEAKADSEAYRQADRLLLIPDLVNQRLTGRMCNELTDASTSQLLDAKGRCWAKPMIEKLGLRSELFGELVEPGHELGPILPGLAERTGLPAGVRVVTVGSHDTASAVAGVPAEGKDWAYLSSGTWSLLGVEVDQPVVNDLSYEHGFTNEAGVCGTIRLLKNIGGLWLLQECRRQRQREGKDYSYAQLTEMAERAEPSTDLIDPDDPTFVAPGGMPNRINGYLTSHGHQTCDDDGSMARMIIESLAARYREMFAVIQQLAGRELDTLHIVGGGSRNKLLNQLTADAIDKRVVAGPVEATATGNILMQMMAGGAVSTLSEGRALIGGDENVSTFMPRSL